ncbi:DUF998 domain-containing protein [Streptomyces sp. NRRL S-244]|uniref:DUF998 domain-containing protein n=1 Tax=Streptomyces sp. NRRL S-244 TaxID=1463897 RepID=UPI0004BE740B|nr:DUF998 domain-containing protein [Streptomyces sp. NRRL S-244]
MRELTFTASRGLAAGGLLWASLAQIFVVNNAIVLPRASSRNLVEHIISALGDTRCGLVGGFRFCSPWHEAADIAWIIGGVCLIVGALLNAAVFPPDRLRNLAFGVLAVSGVGLVSTGFNPYNLRPAVHLLSAGTCFFCGAVGVLLLGGMLRQAHRPYWGAAGILCGVTSIVSATLTALRPDPYVQGLFERIAAWPSVVWVICFGTYIAVSTRRAYRGRGRGR